MLTNGSLSKPMAAPRAWQHDEVPVVEYMRGGNTSRHDRQH